MSYKDILSKYKDIAKRKRETSAQEDEGQDGKKAAAIPGCSVTLSVRGNTLDIDDRRLVNVLYSHLSLSSTDVTFYLGNSNGTSFDWHSSTLTLDVSNDEKLQSLTDLFLRRGVKFYSDSNLIALKGLRLSDHTYNPSKSIVMARYNEPIKWVPVDWYPHMYLYDKNDGENLIKDDVVGGMASIANSVKHYEILSNVGRESHTYLVHIIQHYDTLTDVVYFTQAEPIDHCPDYVTLINANVGKVLPFSMLGDRHTIRDHNVSQYEKNFPGIQAGFHRTFKHLFYANTSKDDNEMDEKVTNDEEKEKKDFKPKVSYQEMMRKTDRIVFTPGALFAVKKEQILKRPKAFYEHASALLDKDKNPIEGHAFERMWNLIFNPHLLE